MYVENTWKIVRRLKKCFFVENYENSKFHIFLILLSYFHQIFTVLFKTFYSFY